MSVVRRMVYHGGCQKGGMLWRVACHEGCLEGGLRWRTSGACWTTQSNFPLTGKLVRALPPNPSAPSQGFRPIRTKPVWLVPRGAKPYPAGLNSACDSASGIIL